MSELRQKILDIAYRQFDQNGYDNVTMRSIANDLGVTHPALYTYFKSKEDIFANLKVQIFRQLKESLFVGVNPHGTFKEITQKMAENFIEFMDRERAYFKIIFLLEGNGESSQIQLQILEYIDALLVLPESNVNLPQIFWYSLLGHCYARYSQEVTPKKQRDLVAELVDRLSKSQ